LLIVVRFFNYLAANNKGIRKRLLTFLIFVFISSAFWLYRALDDVYTTTIQYPVNYINLPKNKVLAGNPPQVISIKVKGYGYTLLSNMIKPPILDLNVNDFSLFSQTNDSLNVYFISRYSYDWFKEEINGKNHSPVQIVGIEPDTVKFSFSRSYAKKVPVKLVFNTQKQIFARQHMLNGKIRIEPDSIMVAGSANGIDTMHYVYSEIIDVSDLKDTIIKKVDLVENRLMKYSTTKVKYTIPVDRFTESDLEVPVSVRNIPDSISMKVFPRTVKVTYMVTLTMYNSVSESDFNPYIDYKEVNGNNEDANPKLNVYLDSVPGYTYSVSWYPQSVEYLIERNND
jgi:hypothetical protein